MSENIRKNIESIRNKITEAEKTFGRKTGSVVLLAVTKKRTVEEIKEAIKQGIKCFGENYLQEALPKIEALKNYDLEWHFIGPIQSNKTKLIAENFSWVESVERLKIAERLNDQRPHNLPPLNVCIEVNLSGEESKSGVFLDDVLSLANEIKKLPQLKLRGLMSIPAPSDDFEHQRLVFRKLKEKFEELNKLGLELDTLSIGMTDDFEAAIAEGSTIVRIGTAIFGQRS